MSHMIDETTGTAAIAYAGDAPWHGLGQQLQPGASLDTWREQAGLNWTAEKSPVRFLAPDGDVQKYDDRSVLFRSDTRAPLSVVSTKGYRPVQPSEVIGFFAKIVAAGGFQMETAGALSGGKRIWALARVNEGAQVIGHDVVRPYLLLATSYDATMATTAKFVAERVVCHNTISLALAEDEASTSVGIASCVKVLHSRHFDVDAVHDQLGIVHGAFDRFLKESKRMAEERLTLAQADALAYELLKPTATPGNRGPLPDVRKSARFQQLLDLFNGDAIGSDLTGGDSKWQFLNAVTEYVDHHRGRSQDTRLNAAWFGDGDRMKSKARELLLAA